MSDMLLYHNEEMAVLNKPGNIPVQDFASQFADMFADNIRLCVRRGIKNASPHYVHRLDKHTSGCLVVGFTSNGRRRLHKIFEARLVKKVYFAVVNGELTVRQTTINSPLLYDKDANLSRIGEGGKQAQTEVDLLAIGEGLSLVRLRPITGRTHQLRVHLRSIGHPILGDEKYGTNANPPLFLHAREIHLPTRDGNILAVRAPLPAHMRDVFRNVLGTKKIRNLELK